MSSITVFSGPMKCGKSTRLINEAKKWKHTDKKIQIFKPFVDNRSFIETINDRNGNELNAINIENIDDIKNYDADVYFIDEFQFLNGNISTIQDMVSDGKQFFIAGLNLTAEKKPFGKMGELICNADSVEMLSSICECCHENNAIYSFCKVKKENDILIGDSEYIPVCPSCYNKLDKERRK